MNKKEYLINILVQNEEDLIGREILHVYNFGGLILFLDNGKVLLTKVIDNGWDEVSTIDSNADSLWGMIEYGGNFKNVMEEYSNFNWIEFSELN